jgi:hypothetical protein
MFIPKVQNIRVFIRLNICLSFDFHIYSILTCCSFFLSHYSVQFFLSYQKTRFFLKSEQQKILFILPAVIFFSSSIVIFCLSAYDDYFYVYIHIFFCSNFLLLQIPKQVVCTILSIKYYQCVLFFVSYIQTGSFVLHIFSTLLLLFMMNVRFFFLFFFFLFNSLHSHSNV